MSAIGLYRQLDNPLGMSVPNQCAQVWAELYSSDQETGWVYISNCLRTETKITA